MPASTLREMRRRLDALIEALEGGDTAGVRREGEAFLSLVDEAWGHFSGDRIKTDGKALTKVLYMFVKDELPGLLQDPRHYERAMVELRRFRRVMDSVLKPQDNTPGGQNA